MTEEDAEYGLVMPFVVCKSRGGPYDDNSFVAGVRFGVLDMELQRGTSAYSGYEPTDLVPQIDLLAMKHGYRMTATPWEDDPDEWTLVELERDFDV